MDSPPFLLKTEESSWMRGEKVFLSKLLRIFIETLLFSHFKFQQFTHNIITFTKLFFQIGDIHFEGV